MLNGRNPENEIVRIDGDTGDVLDRSGRLIGGYIETKDLDTTDPIIRGVVEVGFGESFEVPLASGQFTGDDYVAVSGPSFLKAFGIFALGWAGGYLAWVAIGNYQKKRQVPLYGLSGRRMKSLAQTDGGRPLWKLMVSKAIKQINEAKYPGKRDFFGSECDKAGSAYSQGMEMISRMERHHGQSHDDVRRSLQAAWDKSPCSKVWSAT